MSKGQGPLQVQIVKTMQVHTEESTRRAQERELTSSLYKLRGDSVPRSADET